MLFRSTTRITSREEGETRLLATLRAAFPQCVDVVPETWDGMPWSDLLDRLWALARLPLDPGLEGSSAVANAAEAIARGAPFQFESVQAATSAAEAEASAVPAGIPSGTHGPDVPPGWWDPEPGTGPWADIDEDD